MGYRELLPGEYVVLAALAVRPMHGYELSCFLDDEGIGAVCPVEQSTLYTYLRNVESRGFVDWTEERVGHRPPRKIYQLTADGRALADAWLRRPVARMREVRLELLVKLFFLDRLDRAAERTLLAQQIETCQDYLARLEARPVASAFARLVAQSKRSAAEATLSWLRQYARELESEVA